MKTMTNKSNRQDVGQVEPPEPHRTQHRDKLMQQKHGLHLWRTDSDVVSSNPSLHLSVSGCESTGECSANTYDKSLGFLTQNKATILQQNCIPVQSHPSYQVDYPPLVSQIQKIRECERHPSEILPAERKKEIVRMACDAFPFVVATRQEHLKSLRRASASLHGESQTNLMNRAAWSSMSTTDSNTGCRFMMGFRNVGCAYWRENPFHIGCFSCGYCSGIIPEVEPTQDQLEMQFENALEQALETRVDFDVVEFLNDGSFFNDEEFSPSFRRQLFRRVNSLPYVKRVLVETRPEYVNKENVSHVLSELSPDKNLEVAIGLESADEFIRSVCIRKGFSCNDFEEAIKCLSSFDGRINVLAYSLVKPAFLSELEAIEDQINTAQYLARLSSQYKCKITMKLEPAVVAKGTLLDFLYFHGQENINHAYTVMSYWTVIEILCRLRRENIKLSVRVGSRNDMDVIEKVPALYDSSGMFSKWDFVVYEAIQHFNVHGSVERLLTQIEGAFSDKSFENWKQQLGFQTTAIEECRKEFAGEIEQLKGKTDERSRQAFLLQVFAALDRIECEERGVQFAKMLAYSHGRRGTEEVRAAVQEFIAGEFRQITKDVWLRILDVYFEVDGLRLMRICLQVRDTKKKDALYSIWIGIPTQTMRNRIEQQGSSESERLLTELPLAI